MKTFTPNYDLGNSIIFISFTQETIDSKIVTLTLNFKSVGKIVQVMFDANAGNILTITPVGLTPTQMHTIATLVTQFLKP